MVNPRHRKHAGSVSAAVEGATGGGVFLGPAASATMGPVFIKATSAPVSSRSAPSHASAKHGRANRRPEDRGGSILLPAPIVHTIFRFVATVPYWLWAMLALMGCAAAVSAARARLMELRSRRLERQRHELLEDVGLLQRALLPEPGREVAGVDTSVAYRPADGPAAGGDFYDVFGLDDGRVGVIIGDISGHGRSALPATGLVRFTLRAYLEAGLAPRDVLRTAAPILERQMPDDLHVTALVATYDPSDGTTVYSSAGHPPPLVVGPRRFAPVTAASSPTLGSGLPTGRRQTMLRVVGPGFLCFVTDGVLESRLSGELIGRDAVQELADGLEEEGTADDLLGRVLAAADAQADDMAACLLRLPSPTAALPDAHAALDRVELLEVEAADLPGRARRFLTACEVEPDEAESGLREAARLVARDGAALLEVSCPEARPIVTVRATGVSSLIHRRAIPALSRPEEVAR